MAKRRLSVWMVAPAGVLALSLAACGKSEGPVASTDVSANAPVGPVPAAVAPAESPAETPAVAAGTAAVATGAATTSAAPATPTAKAAALPAAPVVKPASPTPAAKAPAANPTPPASAAATRTSSDGEFVDAPGKAVVQQNCTACHAAGTVTGQRKTQAQWRDTVEQMIGYGAPVTDAEFPAIVAYLAKNYGP